LIDSEDRWKKDGRQMEDRHMEDRLKTDGRLEDALVDGRWRCLYWEEDLKHQLDPMAYT